MNTKRFLWSVPVALTALFTLVLGATPASADNLQSDAATTAGITTITAGGSTTITYQLVANSAPSGDPSGCDATSSTPVTVTINAPAAVSAPTSLTFTGCGSGNTKTATFSSSTAGSYNITHTISGGKSGSLFKDQADFTLTVNPATPTNTAPTLSLPSNITAEATGPGGATVTYTATASDAEDGTLTPTCSPASGSTFPLGITQVNCSVTDSGGLTTTGMFNVTVADTTPPTITFHGQSPPANASGWNKTSVTLTWDCSDLVSGNSQVTQNLTNEGANQSATGTCTDGSGNSASNTQTGINIDETAPSVAYTSASPAPNAYGWNNTDVTATFTATDTLSGFAGPSTTQTGTSTTSGEGSAVTVGSPAFTDLAGNTAAAGAATSDAFQIDKTAPTVSVTGVTNGATYTLGSVPTAGCSTTDSLSSVQINATLNTSGGPVGSVTATCSGGKDKADNTAAPVSATYSVIYNWTGFFQPIDNTPTVNTVQAGSGVPVKFSLSGYQGLSIFATGYPKLSTLACSAIGTDPTDAIETTTSSNSGLNYDSTNDQYVYVWKTQKAWAGTCGQLEVKLIDGTTHSAYFKFMK